MAVRGKHIDAALTFGMRLHAKVAMADVKAGKLKERLTDTGVKAVRNGVTVGHVDVVALGGRLRCTSGGRAWRVRLRG